METPDLVKEKTKARHETYDLSQIHTMAKDDFGLEVDQLERLPEDEHGDNSQVFVGELDKEPVVVKISDNARDLELEDASLRLMQERGVPAPRPISWKDTTILQKPAIIEGRLAGTSLQRLLEKGVQPKVLTETGQLLRKMHEIKLKGFGRIIAQDGELVGRRATYKESMVNQSLDRDSLVTPGYITEEDFDLLQRALDQIIEDGPQEASFVHYDFHPEHVYTDGEHVTGFIDFANARASDPRFDIAKVHYDFPEEFQRPFDEGYGELAHDRLMPHFEALVAAQKLMYRHEEAYSERIPEGIRVLKQKIDKI